MFEGLSPLHLIAILVIALLILGPGKLPEVGAALGKSIREFRRSVSDLQEPVRSDAPPASAQAAPAQPAQQAPAQPATAAPTAPEATTLNQAPAPSQPVDDK